MYIICNIILFGLLRFCARFSARCDFYVCIYLGSATCNTRSGQRIKAQSSPLCQCFLSPATRNGRQSLYGGQFSSLVCQPLTIFISFSPFLHPNKDSGFIKFPADRSRLAGASAEVVIRSATKRGRHQDDTFHDQY